MKLFYDVPIVRVLFDDATVEIDGQASFAMSEAIPAALCQSLPNAQIPRSHERVTRFGLDAPGGFETGCKSAAAGEPTAERDQDLRGRVSPEADSAARRADQPAARRRGSTRQPTGQGTWRSRPEFP
jgi:hypothetical protein